MCGEDDIFCFYLILRVVLYLRKSLERYTIGIETGRTGSAIC
jgi:hypothetical protein